MKKLLLMLYLMLWISPAMAQENQPKTFAMGAEKQIEVFPFHWAAHNLGRPGIKSFQDVLERLGIEGWDEMMEGAKSILVERLIASGCSPNRAPIFSPENQTIVFSCPTKKIILTLTYLGDTPLNLTP